jgi:hypothetical protein
MISAIQKMQEPARFNDFVRTHGACRGIVVRNAGEATDSISMKTDA